MSLSLVKKPVRMFKLSLLYIANSVWVLRTMLIKICFYIFHMKKLKKGKMSQKHSFRVYSKYCSRGLFPRKTMKTCFWGISPLTNVWEYSKKNVPLRFVKIITQFCLIGKDCDRNGDRLSKNDEKLLYLH